jgi:hypothetical protein
MNLISTTKEIRVSYVFNVDGQLIHHVEYEKENGQVTHCETFFDSYGESVSKEIKEKIKTFVDNLVAYHRPEVVR